MTRSQQPASPRRRTLGELDVIEVPGSADGPVVVLLHGFGANWQDLLPLHQVLQAPADTTWLFPNAPLTMDIGPHSTGRAWFPIDVEAINRAMMTGAHRDRSTTSPPGLEAARAQVQGMLDALGRPMSSLILGGFSQGAMIATEVGLTTPQPAAGLVLMSATLLHADVWRQAARQRAGLRFVQTHGRQDPLLSVADARRLHTLLTDAGLDGELLEFDGQHEIPPVALHKINGFLSTMLPNQPTPGAPA